MIDPVAAKEILSLLALHPSHLQGDLLLHFLLNQTHPNMTPPVSPQPGKGLQHIHLSKRRFRWLFLCSSPLWHESQTAQPFPKTLNSFTPRILNHSWLHTNLSNHRGWCKRCSSQQRCSEKPALRLTSSALHFPAYFTFFVVYRRTWQCWWIIGCP